MRPIYTARERFGPADGKGWDDYVAWSRLSHLDEVVSLDGMLCPFVVTFADDLWDVVVNEDYMLDFFVDLDPLLHRLPADGKPVNILAVFRQPEADMSDDDMPGFRFMGYDLMDQMHENSALTNCGGFDDVFAGSELNRSGLLDRLDRAVEVRDQLKQLYPEEHHADCDVWAIFRMQHTADKAVADSVRAVSPSVTVG